MFRLLIAFSKNCFCENQTIMKNLVIIICDWGRAGLFSLILILALVASGCGDSACQIVDPDSTARVECDGKCPSESRPNCYVKFRKENSTDDWEKSGQSSMDRTPGMEFACYCDI